MDHGSLNGSFAIVAVLPKSFPWSAVIRAWPLKWSSLPLRLGFDLLLGYTGILSFGQAAYFGLAAYTMGIVCIQFKVPILLGMLSGIAMGTLAAVIIGLLIIRKTGIYFAMLTIAFGQMFFFIASRWKTVTGGEDGLTGIPRDVIPLGIFN